MKDDTARRLRNSGSEGVVRVSKFSSTILASCACLHPREVENDDIQYGGHFAGDSAQPVNSFAFTLCYLRYLAHQCPRKGHREPHNSRRAAWHHMSRSLP
jgi:hypothetical protein